ncbi:MAG TPA: alpha/beta hydrolase-fold protein [Verrucomicrobiae bacterium]|nr:alpha/beta hydrolase-fold protein [Verrucomicrobiae bacterium]
MKQIYTILFAMALGGLNGATLFAQTQNQETQPAQPQAQSQSSTNRTARRGGGRDPKMDAHYKLGPDSMPQEGVPKGHFDGPKVIQSEVFSGTQHTYWVYVPAQYDPAKPASLIIFNDGQAFKNEPGDVQAQNVLDNLIYRREIPVMIAVFINPGRRPDQPEPSPSNWGDRDTNRPEEYNALNEKYPRVIVDELLPVIRKEYNISPDPEQHAIGGASSGGIAAFTVAWHRPEQFRKVFTFVGSFVDLGNRKGNTYPDIVLESEKKPLRVYLQDGRNDNRGLFGRPGGDPHSTDWFYQNVRLAAALTKKGYEVNCTWGIGNHGQKQGGAIFPEIMRWLWRDAQAVSTDANDSVERSFRVPAGEAPSSNSQGGTQ